MIKKNGSTCFLCEQCNICPNFRGKPFCEGNKPHFPKNLDNSDRCLKDYQPVASRDDTVYYPTQQWASADILNEIVAIVLKEVLGYRIEAIGGDLLTKRQILTAMSAVATDYGPGKGVDYNMEMWQQGTNENSRREYVGKEYVKYVLER